MLYNIINGIAQPFLVITKFQVGPYCLGCIAGRNGCNVYPKVIEMISIAMTQYYKYIVTGSCISYGKIKCRLIGCSPFVFWKGDHSFIHIDLLAAGNNCYQYYNKY